MADNKVTEAELARNQADRPGARRVTLQDLQENIGSIHFFTALQATTAAAETNPEDNIYSAGQGIADSVGALGLMTMCALVLRNGYVLIGKSACADPKMYNKEIGQRLAREDAEKQIWPLMGYALKQEIYLATLSGSSSGFSRSVSDAELLAQMKVPKSPEATTYIGTKVVHAIPMNRADYNELRGWELPANENGEDEGFLVEYTDAIRPNVEGFQGYVSWSPADVFNQAYREMASDTPVEDGFKARARTELSELTDKIGKLDLFISGKEQFQRLSQDDQHALIAQLNAMRDYQKALTSRVERF